MSPFEIFRRNLKPMMVVLTFLALISFVVLPAIDTYMRRGGGPNSGDVTLASFDGKPLQRSRVEYLTRNHHSTVRFLRELAEETIRRGGAPQTPGFVYDTQNRAIQSIGIDERPSELGTVRTMQFANEAKKAGFELDDTAIGVWLDSFTDQGTVPEGEMFAMLMQSTQNQMGKAHLYEQLRNQLLAELYQRGNVSGLAIDGQVPVVTPVEQWENFLKLNRQATVTTYGVLVSDYMEKTNPTPTEAAIKDTYEAGKDRYPNDQSPEPAFARRESAKFEYVVADERAFIDREKKNFSEADLRAEYDRRLAGGDFQLPQSADDILGFGDEASKDAESTSEASEGASEGEEPPMKEEAAATDADSNDEAKTDEDSNSDHSSAKAKQAADSKTGESAEKETESAKEDESAKEEKSGDQSHLRLGSAVRLVLFQDDDQDPTAVADDKPAKPASDGKSNKSPSKKPAKKAENNQTKPAGATSEKPANKKPNTKAPDKKSAKADADADAKSTDDADPAKTDSKKSSDAASTDVANDSKMKSDSDSDSENKEKDASATTVAKDEPKMEEAKKDEGPKVETFDDVRDRIAAELAAPEARRKMQEGIAEIESQMRRYFNLNAIHESYVKSGRESKAPVKPDLKALAEKYSMQHEVIGPHNIVSLRDEPISQSFELTNEAGRPGPPFGAMMFGVSNNQNYVPKQAMYFPLRTAEMSTGKMYVSWKTEENESYTPELEEVRDEVIEAIRTEEARELARIEAVRLADEANEGKDLATLVPDDKKSNLKEALGPFSWMNSFGFGGAFLGNVPELDSVGEEFMAETFRTKEGQYGVAANLPERVVYVIQPNGFQPSVEELRRRFKEPRERMMAMFMGTEDIQSVMRGFYESVDQRSGFSFEMPTEE